MWIDNDLQIIRWLNDRPSVKQFIKFSLIGGFNTLVDLAVYVFFTRIVYWHYLSAAIMAFFLAASCSFLLNKYWTFKVNHQSFSGQYFKFILVASGGLLWTLFFLYIFVDHLHWYDILAKVLTIIIVMNWNFWLQKLWTFKVN